MLTECLLLVKYADTEYALKFKKNINLKKYLGTASKLNLIV